MTYAGVANAVFTQSFKIAQRAIDMAVPLRESVMQWLKHEAGSWKS